MWHKLFLAHPASVNESYVEHMGIALRFGATMIVGGLACLAHAIVPAIFPRTASRTVRELNVELQARQDRFRRASGEWQLEYEI